MGVRHDPGVRSTGWKSPFRCSFPKHKSIVAACLSTLNRRLTGVAFRLVTSRQRSVILLSWHKLTDAGGIRWNDSIPMTCTGSSPSRTSFPRSIARRFQRPSSNSWPSGPSDRRISTELNHHPCMKPGSFLRPRSLLCAIAQGPDFPWNPLRQQKLRSSDLKKSRGAIASLDAAGVEQYLGRQAWFGGIPRRVLRAPAVHVSPLSFGNRHGTVAPTHCHWKEYRNYRRRGYLFCQRQNQQRYTCSFSGCYGTGRSTAMPFLWPILLHRSSGADPLISAIAVLNFEGRVGTMLMPGRNHGRAVGRILRGYRGGC